MPFPQNVFKSHSQLLHHTWHLCTKAPFHFSVLTSNRGKEAILLSLPDFFAKYADVFFRQVTQPLWRPQLFLNHPLSSSHVGNHKMALQGRSYVQSSFAHFANNLLKRFSNNSYIHDRDEAQRGFICCPVKSAFRWLNIESSGWWEFQIWPLIIF